MSQEEDKLLDHNFDGIQEFDNPMPTWWVGLFVFTIIWAIGYMFFYEITGIGNTQLDDYHNELAAAAKQYGGDGVEEAVVEIALLTAPDQISEGEKIFKMNCSSCHGQAGEGGIGPNLGDSKWLHGGDFKSIVNTITHGVPEKGMISWEPILKTKKIVQVASYIDQKFRNTNPPKGKAPEGEEYKGE